MNDIVTNVTMPDGFRLCVKLSEPDNPSDSARDAQGSIRPVVLFVQSSGPHTCDDERECDGRRFRCFDLFANELTRRGVAFCRYSTRGVYPGGEPPMFVTIDDNEYKTYLPGNTTDDIVRLTEWLRCRGYTRIALLGWSEGSVIAPLAVKRGARADRLLLAGYLGRNLRDILCWQLSGNSSSIFYRRFFDYDRKGYISESDFDEDRFKVRAALFGTKSFAELDINRDGRLDADDFKPETERHLSGMLAAIDRGDDDWLRKNHGVRLTSDVGYLVIKAKLTEAVPKDAVVVYEAWFKDSPFNVNYLVKAVPADMGAYATGMPGLAFHDAFVAVEKA